MKCRKCKQEIPEEKGYCPGCGYVPGEKKGRFTWLIGKALLGISASAVMLLGWYFS